MPRPRKKTVGDLINQISELEQRASIQQTLISILKSRYLPKDSAPKPVAQISCNGAPVSTDLIEEVVDEMEKEVSDTNKRVAVYKAEEIKNV